MNANLEKDSAQLVGRLVFAFSRLEFLVGLCLRNLSTTSTPNRLDPLIDRLSFKGKLDALHDVVQMALSLDQGGEEFCSWYKQADSLRAKRNAFVHGRWGFHPRSGETFNASSRLGQNRENEVRTFSLAELEAEVVTAENLVRAFDVWHRKRVVHMD